jgi:hypothetical protein
MCWNAGVHFPAGSKTFSGTPQCPDQRVYYGVKPQGREADYSPPSSAEIKNDGAIPPLPIRLYDGA